MYATLFDKAHPLTGTAGDSGGGSFSIGLFTSDLYYNEPLPKGPYHSNCHEHLSSFPWSLEVAWTPPQTQTPSTPQLFACLTRESWEQTLQSHDSLPAGLSGTLALAELSPPDYYYHVSVAKLDSSGSKSLGFGPAPSLSPDGTNVVHIGPVVNSPANGRQANACDQQLRHKWLFWFIYPIINFGRYCGASAKYSDWISSLPHQKWLISLLELDPVFSVIIHKPVL